ncbi:unnamed protein product [Rotaria sp. Silwood1]|nr:unnamed protein product [Rotaria sp. Silwood1]
MGQTPCVTYSTTSVVTLSSMPSEFYVACRNGDVKKVEQILPQLNIAHINCLESNGSSPLHAASFYGHKTIVQMLLENGAKPWLINKYKMTPYEEAANDEIRSLFRRPLDSDMNRFSEDDTNNKCLELISKRKIDENGNQIPNGWINGYKNIGKYSRCKDIKLIIRAQIIKYYLASLQQSNDCARELQQILKHNVPSDHRDYKNACFLFDEYCSRNQIEYLIRLYTLETNFYRALHSNVEIFTVEIYSQLETLKNRFFQGQSYRGLSMTTKDIDEYKWAIHNQGTLIEIKTLTSTSVNSKVAYKFARGQKTNNTDCHRVFCEFHFDHRCSTAIDLRHNSDKNLLCLSAYENEAEVLVLPGTLFEVRDVRQKKDTNRYTIILHNIYVPLHIILDAFKEVQT